MEQIVCLNSNSFPATDTSEAYRLFTDTIYGLLELRADRYSLYYDSTSSNTLDEFELSGQYNFSDYKEQLLEAGEHDLLGFLNELEDKSPAIDYISDDILEEVGSYSFYIPGHPPDSNPDVLSLSWFLSAVLLSIPTEERWDSHIVSIARIEDDGRFIDEELTLKNIAKYDHGVTLYQDSIDTDIKNICELCDFSSSFIEWYDKQSKDNRQRVTDKLKLSSDRDFQGGEPLFKNLENGGGLREVRFNAYPGGAIRILFKSLNGRHALLTGFIKKSNNEGYANEIPKALEILEGMTFG